LKITKIDILVIAILVSASVFFIQKPNDGVKKLYLITESEKKAIPLKEQTIHLKEGKVVIEVSEDGARFIHSDCHNHTCVNSGWITKCGETVACIPNKFALVIECGKDAYDAYSE